MIVMCMETTPELNFQIMNIELENSLKALMETEIPERIPKETLATFTTLLRNGFRAFFHLRYDKPMNPIGGSGSVIKCKIKVQPALGNEAVIELNLSRMVVEYIYGADIIGHMSSDKFFNWLRTVDLDDIIISTEFSLMYNEAEQFPNFLFKAKPNDYLYNYETHDVFQVKSFVPVNEYSTVAINTVTNETITLKLDEDCGIQTGDMHTFFAGISALHELNITEYGQLFNFLHDEWYDDRYRTLAETDGGLYVAINDMLELVCLRTKPVSSTMMLFVRLLEIMPDAPNDVMDIIADFMVYGGSAGFNNLSKLLHYKNIKTHVDFEKCLSEYYNLSIFEKGAVSTFLNHTDNVIRRCLTKVLGEGLPHPDIELRVYYHNVIWGKNAPTVGRPYHVYTEQQLKTEA